MNKYIIRYRGVVSKHHSFSEIADFNLVKTDMNLYETYEEALQEMVNELSERYPYGKVERIYVLTDEEGERKE